MEALDIEGKGLRMPDGTLRAFTDLGSYPLFYCCKRGEVVCPKCAHADGQTEDPHGDTFLTECAVHWEGEPLICDACGADIESAYGPVT